MSNPFEILHAAATLMRERADAAGTRPSEHIASWHPAVALAVSDVLEYAADSARTSLNRGWEPEVVAAAPGMPEALALARAYLGDGE